MPFSRLGLSPVLCTTLTRLGYTQPTPVQLQSLPVALAGRDLFARAQTGTGKTAAFGLPMIERLLVAQTRPLVAGRPRGLVLVPTRELAQQVHEALTRYGAQVKARVAAIYGGVPGRLQRRALRDGLHIAVATPGRLLDHLDAGAIDLGAIEVLVLDEADRMLDMGFLPPLRRILAALPRQRQTLLLSATLGREVETLASAFTRDPIRVDVSPSENAATTVSHHLHPAPEGRKGELLAHVLQQAPADQAIVFCKTKHGSNRVGEQLLRLGVRTAVIHGNKSQAARHRALDDFKARRARVLVATDVAARGLDIAHLPLVVNYDLPLVAQDYIHRVGRTGRAGLAGRAISLVSPSERHLLAGIERLLPARLERIGVEGFDVPVNETSRTDPARRREAPRPTWQRGSYAPRPAGREAAPGNRGRRPRSARPAPSSPQRRAAGSTIL